MPWQSMDEREAYREMVELTVDPDWDLHSLQRESQIERQLIQKIKSVL